MQFVRTHRHDPAELDDGAHSLSTWTICMSTFKLARSSTAATDHQADTTLSTHNIHGRQLKLPSFGER